MAEIFVALCCWTHENIIASPQSFSISFLAEIVKKVRVAIFLPKYINYV